MADDNDNANQILRSLKRLAITGAYLDADVAVHGLPVDYDPAHNISLAAIEAIVASITDPLTRALLGTRLGLRDNRSIPVRDRNEMFARLLGTRNYSGLSRSQQDAPLRLLGTALGRHAFIEATQGRDAAVAVPVGAYDRWDVIDYEEERIFPLDSMGDGISINTRRIRSRVSGLTEFRITQTVTWASGRLPTYVLMRGESIRIENQTPVTQSGQPGYRFDLVIQIPSLDASETETETISWVRSYRHGPGDIYVPGEMNTMDLTPIVYVDHAAISIRFDTEHLPKEAFSFSGVPSLDRLTVPMQFRTPLEVRHSVGSIEFQKPAKGYSYGIGWVW